MISQHAVQGGGSHCTDHSLFFANCSLSICYHAFAIRTLIVQLLTEAKIRPFLSSISPLAKGRVEFRELESTRGSE